MPLWIFPDKSAGLFQEARSIYLEVDDTNSTNWILLHCVTVKLVWSSFLFVQLPLVVVYSSSFLFDLFFRSFRVGLHDMVKD